MKLIKVYSHPRSGTGLLMTYLATNFYKGQDVSTPQGRAGHWANRGKSTMHIYGKLSGDHGTWRKGLSGIYIYRDCRDVALSVWNTKMMLNPEWHTLTFSAFLRKPLDWEFSPARKVDKGFSICEHWRRHLDSWHQRTGIHYVRYENLVMRPEYEMMRIAERFDVAVFDFVPVDELVGLSPNQGRIGAWRDVFTEDDLAYAEKTIKGHWGIYE